MGIEIFNSKGGNIILNCVYRPPSGKINQFNNSIKHILTSTIRENKKLIIGGDFNIDSFKYDQFRNTQYFFDLLFELNVFPSIYKPTRVTKHSATNIDNILSDNLFSCNYESGIFKTDISDHFPTFLIIDGLLSNKKDNNITYIYKRDLSVLNLNNLKHELYNQSWDDVYNSNDTDAA